MKLILVRHGQTLSNVTRTIQGSSDSKLSAHGQRQIRCLAESLGGWQFDAVYASDLSRALDTAKAIVPDSTIVLDKRLREWDLGHWTGLPRAYINEHFADEIAAYESRIPDFGPRGGETKLEVERRSAAYLNDIVPYHLALGTGTVLIVSHYGPIRAMLTHLVDPDGTQGWNPYPKVDNTGVTQLDLKDNACTVDFLNNLEHLEQLATAN